jgi:hypothetical protein
VPGALLRAGLKYIAKSAGLRAEEEEVTKVLRVSSINVIPAKAGIFIDELSLRNQLSVFAVAA